MVRLGFTRKQGISGFSPTAVFGYFCAAAAAGKLLDLTEEQHRNAIGIAYSQIAGNGQGHADAAWTKQLLAGFAARDGVFSALLAQKGYHGTVNTFDGPDGLWNVYFHGDCLPELVTRDLGKRFESMDLSHKMYPGGGLTQPAIQAAVDLVAEYRFEPQDIKEVNLTVSQDAYETYCQPLEIKTKPRNLVDANFSMPYGVATGLTFGRVGVGDYTDDAVKRPEVLDLLQRFTVTVDQEITKRFASEERGARNPMPSHRWVTVAVKMKDDKVYSKRLNAAKGRPENPWSSEDFEKKYWDCVDHAAKPLDRKNTEKAWELLSNLEDVTDVTEIVWLLS
jgi:2-methylcitrate dehydratase PrpD